MSERYPKSVPVSPDNPAIEKDEDICANCSHCLAVCAEEIGVAQPCKVRGCLPGAGNPRKEPVAGSCHGCK